MKGRGSMDRLYIVIPAYNEEANIEAVIKEWYPIVERIGNDSRLVIIDDGSKDNTYPILQKFSGQMEQLVGITKPNGGHGATILYGYNYAIEAGADYIFQTDSDGQTLPEEFWDFWEIRNSYDMVIGNRDGRKDGASRVLVTKVLKLVLYLCFHVKVTDANTPFRLMKASTLRKYIDLIPKDYNLSNVMVSVIYAKKKLAVKYIPITFRQRQGGVNSINMKKIFGIGIQAIKDFRRMNQSVM